MRLRGAVSTQEFVELAGRIGRKAKAVGHVRLLLDWRALKAWDLEDWSAPVFRPWIVASHRIGRVAIVHHAAWNRQAALIAAILRRENVSVRSWKHDRMTDARRWLLAPAGQDAISKIPAAGRPELRRASQD